MNRLNIHRWPLDMPAKRLESRFRRRSGLFGPLIIVPACELVALIERASIVSRQLSLPFELSACSGGG